MTRKYSAPKTISYAFEFRPGIDLDKLNQLADELESEAYAATHKAMSLDREHERNARDAQQD